MTTENLFLLAVYTFIGSLAGLVGGIAFLYNQRTSKLLCTIAVPFAAGVLLTVGLTDLLPEAAEEAGEVAFLVTLIAILTAFFIEQFFAHLHHHGENGHTQRYTSVPLVLVGDTLHNVVDGIAIGAAFLVEPSFALIVAISTLLHEAPHEIADMGILISSGWSKGKALLANALSASSAFVGAFGMVFLAETLEGLVGIFLAISAGLFIYLGLGDFLPQLGEERERALQKFTIMLVGVVVMLLVIELTPGHGHG